MTFSQKIFNVDDFPYEFEKGRAFVPLIRGKCCFIISEGEVFDRIKQQMNLSDKDCLKVFMDPMLDDKLENYYWGDAPSEKKFKEKVEIGYISKLVEATEAQNICAKKNLAPEVFDIILFEKKQKLYPVQITEYLVGENSSDKKIKEVEIKIHEELKKNGYLFSHGKLRSHKDYIDNKLIDFQGCRKKKKEKNEI